MIQHTNCIGIMPRHSFEQEASCGVLHGIKLRNLKAYRTVGVMRLEAGKLSPLDERFIDALRETARDINEGTASTTTACLSRCLESLRRFILAFRSPHHGRLFKKVMRLLMRDGSG
jgi:hypothetical protein